MSAEHVFVYAQRVWREPSSTVYFTLLHRLLVLNQLYLMGAFLKYVPVLEGLL